uniref:Uncharacterized protein n=1 Tax=Oryza glumipatula TaxID=40148 RepID=A0A0E0BMA7_9ORYZ
MSQQQRMLARLAGKTTILHRASCSTAGPGNASAAAKFGGIATSEPWKGSTPCAGTRPPSFPPLNGAPSCARPPGDIGDIADASASDCAGTCGGTGPADPGAASAPAATWAAAATTAPAPTPAAAPTT